MQFDHYEKLKKIKKEIQEMKMRIDDPVLRYLYNINIQKINTRLVSAIVNLISISDFEERNGIEHTNINI